MLLRLRQSVAGALRSGYGRPRAATRTLSASSNKGPNGDERQPTGGTPSQEAEHKLLRGEPPLRPLHPEGSRGLPDADVKHRVRRAAVSAFFVGSGLGVVLPVLPLFVQSLGCSATQVGLAMGVVGVTRLFLHGPATAFCTKYGQRPFLIGGAVVAAVGLTMTGTATSVEEVYLWRTVFAAGSAFELTAMQLYLTDISTPQNRASVLAPSGAAFSAGATFGPAIGGFLLDSFGATGVPFFAVGACIALTAVNNALLPALEKPSAAPTAEKKPDNLLTSGTLGAIEQVRTNPNVRAAVISMTVFWATACGAVFALVPVLATADLSMTGSQVGLMFGAMSLLNAVGATTAAQFSDKHGRKVMMVPALGIAACAAASMPLATSTFAIAASIMAWGVAAMILGPTPTALVSDSTNTSHSRGLALAALRSAGDVGLIVGPPLLGAVADHVGTGAAFGTGAAMLAACSLLSSRTITEPKRCSK
eukprot:INCI10693.2.p1 GENE.INCI10693.2~~INCI10693.2.p1  ORF type:complete len:477 (-),score=56.66 INCI10693.2:1386-2816(-)